MARQSPSRATSAKLLACMAGCSLLTAAVLHRFVIAVYVIEGSSMSPTLNHGDTALVNMLVGSWGRLSRGEIVLVRDGLGDYATKRIIGLPGEKVEIKDAKVCINDHALEERYLPKGTVTGSEYPPVVLGPDEYFVLGDNRSDSYDSRIYGPVSKRAIMGSYTQTFWAFR